MAAVASLAAQRSRGTAASKALAVATWNIHGAVGTDGRYAPERIVDVLKEVGADIVALQEVASVQAHENFLRDLERATGFHLVAGLLRQRHGSDFGNAVLSRFPVHSVEHLDLAVHDYEPRGALDVCIDVGLPSPLRVVATHLGLRPGERREQVRRIIAAVERDSPHPTLLMGDLNEWYLWGRPLRWLHARFCVMRTPATFPAHRPVLKLDRIWAHPTSALQSLRAHRTPLSRVASDHLPLVAEFSPPPLTCARMPVPTRSTEQSTP
jgi:endonuclease/exonuclease/phosphatase family metal-dependent hydrolase